MNHRLACKPTRVALILTAVLAVSAARADALTCNAGHVTIVPSPLPSGALATFSHAQPGTRIYSYDIITVEDGKTTQDFLPTARLTCDAHGFTVTANATRTTFPATATVFSHSLHTWAVFPGLPATADQLAQIRMGRTRLVRTVTAASAAAADAATPSPAPSPSPSPSPKRKRF